MAVKIWPEVAKGTYRHIRCDGTDETIGEKPTMALIRQLIGAKFLDSVILEKRGGLATQVMVCDDSGMVDGKPVNDIATRIYHMAYSTPFSIHGDVVIVHDGDFAKR